MVPLAGLTPGVLGCFRCGRHRPLADVSHNLGEVDPPNNTKSIFYNCADIEIVPAPGVPPVPVPGGGGGGGGGAHVGCETPSAWMAEAVETTPNGAIAHTIFYDADRQLVRWDRAGALRGPAIESVRTIALYNETIPGQPPTAKPEYDTSLATGCLLFLALAGCLPVAHCHALHLARSHLYCFSRSLPLTAISLPLNLNLRYIIDASGCSLAGADPMYKWMYGPTRSQVFVRAFEQGKRTMEEWSTSDGMVCFGAILDLHCRLHASLTVRHGYHCYILAPPPSPGDICATAMHLLAWLHPVIYDRARFIGCCVCAVSVLGASFDLSFMICDSAVFGVSALKQTTDRQPSPVSLTRRRHGGAVTGLWLCCARVGVLFYFGWVFFGVSLGGCSTRLLSAWRRKATRVTLTLTWRPRAFASR